MSSQVGTPSIAWPRLPTPDNAVYDNGESNRSHIAEEAMPGTRRQDLSSEEVDGHLGPIAEILIRSQERSDARIIDAIAGRKTWSNFATVGAVLIAALALFSNMTGAQYRNAGESALSEKVAVLTEKLESSERRQMESQKLIERSIALLDERNRQLSIMLESRGITMPKQ